MKPLTVISDTHNGALRAAGTTPTTAWQLRQYLNGQLKAIVDRTDTDLCVLGDLFDTGNVPLADVMAVWHIFSDWLNKGHTLYLVRGNHDDTKNLTLLSSFQFLCQLLVKQFPGRVVEVSQPTHLKEHSAYVVCHLPNQDLFDEALKQVPSCTYCLTHANFDNKFAVQSDHSLNLSLDQAVACKTKHIIFAHEHQARTALNGKVFVAGNQFPSSVADCLGNDTKYLTILDGGAPRRLQTWKAKGEYAEQDWRSLVDSGEKFIRVVGKASAAEAADVVDAIAKFRNKSAALVITNATEIEGVADAEQIQITLEQVQAFDVKTALLECLDEREQRVVNDLLRYREAA